MKTLFPRTTLKIPPLLAALGICAANSAFAATEQWQGQPSISASLNWTDAANWNGPKQSYYNQVQFTGVGANAVTDFSVNCILDATTGVAQMPIWELDYIPVNGNYTTLINPGVTLYTGAGYGSMFVGADVSSAAGNPAPVDAVETISFTGDGGTLSVVNTINVGQGSSQADNHNVTLDLSGLGTFQMPGVSGSRLLVGVTRNNVPHSQGTVYLAKTNNISLGSDLQIGYNGNSSNSLPSALYLGLTNAISTGSGNNYIVVGNTGCTNAILAFNPALTNAVQAPVAYFGSTVSGSRGNWWIGNDVGGVVPGHGLCDFTGGNVTIMASSMQLGLAGDGVANGATGVLTFDNGTINADTIVNGNQTVSGGGAGVGIINVNSNATRSASATLIVGTSLTLASVNGTPTTGSSGTLNINGGTVVANTITNGGGVATIAMNKGTLTVETIVGSPAKPIDNISAANSSLNLVVIPGTTNVLVTSLTTGGATNLISITSVPPISSFPARIGLVKYSGSIGGAGYNFGLKSLPPLCAGYLENDTANSAIVLVLTTAPRTLTWTGAINGNWDTTTANWLAGGASIYRESDFVQFFDGATARTVQLTASVSPGGLTVSNTAAYTYAGTGFISGPADLVKQGSGTLVLDNSGINNFTGNVNIGGGTLQVGANDGNGNLPATATINNNGVLNFSRNDSVTLGNTISGSGSLVQAGGATLVVSGNNAFTGSVLVTNGSTLQLGSDWTALGSASGATIIASGSTLDINGRYLGSEPLVVSGSGSGNGAIVDNGGAVYGLTSDITLAGDTTFGYANRWDLSSATLSTAGHPYNLTLVGASGGYFQWSRVKLDTKLADITVPSGNFGVVGSTTLGDPTKTLTLASGSYMTFYSDDTDVSINKRVFNDGATIQNGWGANTMSGEMVLANANYCTFDIGGTSLTLNSVLSGDGVIYKQGNGSALILNGNSPTFTGGVALYVGKVILNGTIGSGITSQSGTTVAGSGTANGPVDVSGTLLPGDANLAGTFTAGGLVLQGGATLTMDLNSSTTTGGGVNDLIQINGDLTVSGNTLYVNPIGASLATGTYTLMTYTGNANGFFSAASTLTPSRYTFTLTNVTTTSPKQVRLIVSGSGGGPTSLAWNNASGDGQWNTAGSLNWSNVVTHLSPDSFYSQDSVLFADATASRTVEVPAMVSPGNVTVNASSDYTIQGAGKISGVTSLVKQGAGKLTINTANDFTGKSSIQNGTVVMGNGSALGASSGTITITNTGALDVNGNYLWGKPIVVSGAGAGNGAIVNSGGGVYGFASSITLAGDTTFGGNRLDLASGTTLSTLGKPCNLTLTGEYREFTAVNMDTNIADIDAKCSLGLKDLTTLGNPTNTLTVEAEVSFWSGNGPAKVFRIMPGAKVQYLSGSTFDNAFVFEDGSSFVMMWSGAKTFNGAVKLNGLATLNIGDGDCTFTNVISGPGGIYWANWNSTLTFSAANTYQGMTYLGNGRKLALAGNGSISASSPIIFGGTDGNSTRIDASGRADQTLTLTSGQNLFGIGKITGNLVAQSGAALQPGTNGVLGVLSATGTVALNGTTTMKLNGPGTNDLVQAGSQITYGGTLNLVFTSGTLTAGNTYKLFNASSYTGSFASIVPATPGAGLTWDTTDLINGNLKVASAANPPTIGKITASAGGVLSINGTGGAPNGTYRMLSSTNVALPKASWVQIATGSFDGTGVFSFNLTNSAAEPQKFYLMQVP